MKRVIAWLCSLLSAIGITACDYINVKELQPGVSTATEVRERLRYRSHAPFEPASEYLHASPYVPMLPELRDYAEASLQDQRPLAEAAIDLMQRIHRQVDHLRAQSPQISVPIPLVSLPCAVRAVSGSCSRVARVIGLRTPWPRNLVHRVSMSVASRNW